MPLGTQTDFRNLIGVIERQIDMDNDRPNMIENVNQIKEIITQYNFLIRRAGEIIRKKTGWQFSPDYFDDNPALLSSIVDADTTISVWGDDGGEYDHYEIPLAWLLLDDKELEEAIAEKKQKEAEERAHREEERKKREAEEKVKQERIKEAEERAVLAQLIEKYGVDGGKKDD